MAVAAVIEPSPLPWRAGGRTVHTTPLGTIAHAELNANDTQADEQGNERDRNNSKPVENGKTQRRRAGKAHEHGDEDSDDEPESNVPPSVASWKWRRMPVLRSTTQRLGQGR